VKEAAVIKVEFENGHEQIYDDLDAVAEALIEAVGVSVPNRVYDCDHEGNEIDEGRDYACEWSVELVALDTESNS
jgi:hypothetical protein